jgi:hypothetical protein
LVVSCIVHFCLGLFLTEYLRLVPDFYRIEAVVVTVLEAGKATARRWHLLRLLLAQVSLRLLEKPLMPSWGPHPRDLVYLPLPDKHMEMYY